MKKNFANIPIAPSLLTLLLSGCWLADAAQEAGDAFKSKKNVILMITDGASDGAWDIASFWQHGKLLNETYPYDQLDTRYAMATYPLNGDSSPNLSPNCDPHRYADDHGYNPEKAADTAGSDIEIFPFAGYEYINTSITDSASSGSAIATGFSTYDGAISVDACGNNLTLITQFAKEKNIATGVVSSVPFSHATPAVFGANNLSRKNTAQIGRDLLHNGYLDLIMGTGHPFYDHNGKPTKAKFKYIDENSWTALQNRKLMAKGQIKPWYFFDEKTEFEKLATNQATQEMLTSPLVGIAQNHLTLQQTRKKCGKYDSAFDCPFLPNSPNLSTMSIGALNYLSQNEKGFFVMIEGGAVDWAAHRNDTARIIEEQIDFNQAVTAVYNWVEKNSNWQETLLIVTTDHGNAYVLGENSNKYFFEPVAVTEKYTMPKVKYYSANHTNELVRLYAKGDGAKKIAKYVIGKDNTYSARYRHTGANGEYIQNKHLFDIIKEAF